MLNKIKDDIREQLETSDMAMIELNRFNRACEGLYDGISLPDKLRLFCEGEKWSYEINLDDGELYITTGE